MLLDTDRCYRAVASRDQRFDGQFVTAVRTTGIYCRPSCPAVTPKRTNVEFWPTAAAAQLLAGLLDGRLKKIVIEQLGVDEAEVTPEASFVDDLNADSLDLVELIMSLEEEFGTEISDEDAEKIRTVQDAVDYIDEHSS